MKDNEISIFRSFRFKIVLYTFLSLIFTFLTEVILIFSVKGIRNLLGLEPPATLAQINSNNGNIYMNQIGRGFDNEIVQIPDGTITPLEPFGIWMLLLIFLGIFLFVLYFLALTKKFSLYLKEIMYGIHKIAEGDLTNRIEINDKSEFDLIGNSLNVMAEDFHLLMQNERKNEKEKNDLITNVAHDLRTPLTSILGYLDLTLRNPDMELEKKQKYIEVAYEKSLRLEKLIGDLFSYTKFESNEVVLKMTPINLVKLMEQMIEEFYPAFEEAHLKYEFITDKESAVVMADGDMLARVFSNIISNAIKYGKDGKNIRIYINQDDTEVKVSVVNYGELIPSQDLNHIFDRFYRVENSRNSETGGTGLGLAIVKRIVLMHDGGIRATSNFDGTVFEISLKKGEVSCEK